MRTIRFTNVQIRRLCCAYNRGLFIHKITYLPAAVPPKNSSGLVQTVKIRPNFINDHIYNFSMTAVFKKVKKDYSYGRKISKKNKNSRKSWWIRWKNCETIVMFLLNNLLREQSKFKNMQNYALLFCHLVTISRTLSFTMALFLTASSIIIKLVRT